MAKPNVVLKSDSGKPTVSEAYMAYFSHIENGLIVYRTLPKGGSKRAKSGRLAFKINGVPPDFRLSSVHPIEELKELME